MGWEMLLPFFVLPFIEIIYGLFIFGLIAFLIYLKYRQDEDRTIPTLDLIDAKKIDSMVVKQVENALRPILLAKGHTDAEIEDILTQTTPSRTNIRRY